MASPFRVPGPCTIEFNDVPLGVSKAGVIIRSRTSWSPVTDDAHGTEPADFIFSGKSAQVEVIGLNPAALKTCNIWGDYGGLFQGAGINDIGELARDIGKKLEIIERAAAYTWIALIAVPLDPDMLTLSSTTELVIPVTFLLVPDASDKLFSTFPSYLV